MRPTPVIAYIGLGSNLCDPAVQVRTAMAELEGMRQSRLIARSSLYRTAPVGPADQPDYINAVVALETRLTPRGLLDALQSIERQHGRQRDGTRWGPRTLDLDILLYGDEQATEPGLQIPHPEMSGRAFVLVPLAEIAPAALRVPGSRTLAELVEICPREGIARLPSASGRGVQPPS